MYTLWVAFKQILIESYERAFLAAPFHIVGKRIDNITNQAVFYIKGRRIPTPINLKTSEIISDDKYLSGLSPKDRADVEKQYLAEINTVLAYIMEYPNEANQSREYFFKLFAVEENRIYCGNASYFMTKKKDLALKLSKKDIITLSMSYAHEHRAAVQKKESVLGKNSTKTIL